MSSATPTSLSHTADPVEKMTEIIAATYEIDGFVCRVILLNQKSMSCQK